MRVLALEALCQSTWQTKLICVGAIAADSPVNVNSALTCDAALPGRPALPELVPPAQVPRRKLATVPGRAALIHALAHIEFNAINLALDVIWRFSGMPDQFYRDWLKVAHEEAYHFDLLNRHLAVLGSHYGEVPAHNGMWQMAERTQNDLLARLALVPRTLEARGLDASPAIRQKLAQVGDHAAADILDIILRDEIGHVNIGNRWFKWLCGQMSRDPIAAYRELSVLYDAPKLKGPFNLPARRAAGFDEEEIAILLADSEQVSR